MKNTTTKLNLSNGTLLKNSGVFVDYKPVIVWAMNDQVTKEGLKSGIDSFIETGYGGFMLMPWGGLPYSFMSDEWLEIAEHAADYAEELGIEMWLWDDWIFPSGYGGGEVTRDPAFRAKKLRVAYDIILEPGESISLPLPPHFISASVMEIDKYNCPSGKGTPMLPQGGMLLHKSERRERLVAVVWDIVSAMQHSVASHSEYLGASPDCSIYTNNDDDAFSVDMMNPHATRKFLDCIHERYFSRIGRHFGKTLKGFFFDEPHLPTMYPWTQDFAEEFICRKGYDIREHIPQLLTPYAFYDTEELPRPDYLKSVLDDYNDVWTALVAERFYGIIQNWCREHDVISTGHAGSDDQVSTLFSRSGEMFANMERTDMPGIDIVWGQVGPGLRSDFPRFAGSRAQLRGSGRAISESFAVYGLGVSANEMRFALDHQIVRGVNKFFFKLANYNPEKSRYFHPPELSQENGMMRHFGPLITRRAYLTTSAMNSGKPCSGTLLYLPVRSLRGDKALADEIDNLAARMIDGCLEFDYAWLPDLSRADIGGGSARCGGREYSSIVVPGGANLSDEERAVLDRYRAAGVPVLAGEVPERPGPLSIESPGRVSVRSRRLEDGSYIFMLLNESDEKRSLKLSAEGLLFTLDVVAEEITTLLNRQIDLEATESVLILLRPNAGLSFQHAADEPEDIRTADWRVTLPDETTRELSSPVFWTRLAPADYCGFIRYQCRFSMPATGTAHLSLGDVRYAAKVYVDGKFVQDTCFAPFHANLGELSAGDHELAVDVLNSAANSVCGSESRLRKLEKSGRLNGTYAPLYLPLDRARLESGLNGPVSVKFYRNPVGTGHLPVQLDETA